jgi:type-F conjugative transfer system pilin assembly protein TrbC
VRRCSLLPAWLLSLAAWGAPPGLPDESAIQAEMTRQKARGELLMRRAEESFRSYPGRPMQSMPKVVMPAAGADPLAVAESYRQAQGAKGKQETGPNLLVFVSFAMPRASLERLAADAGKAGAVLVFRGPREGSIRKTLAAFEPLARLGARATLDPEAFAGQRIEAVPVYLLGQAGGCGEAAACAEVLRISGDAGLDDVLERMARADHPLAHAAEGRLARMRGAP